MVKKIKTCIFISGSGTNLKSLIRNSRDYNFPIKIELIISNNINANGLKYARKYNIPYKVFKYKSKIIFEKNCLLELKKRKIKFICLAGFMKVLSKKFIENFRYKIFNIHPSLLPKYKVKWAVERYIRSALPRARGLKRAYAVPSFTKIVETINPSVAPLGFL